MADAELDKRVAANRLLISIFYESPWEKVVNWLFYLRDNQTYKEIPDNHWRCRLAIPFENLHQRWIRKYESDYRKINPRWKRMISTQ